MSECSELITSAYNASAWYRHLAQDSNLNREYWLERAEKAEQVAEKLNNAYTDAIYNA